MTSDLSASASPADPAPSSAGLSAIVMAAGHGTRMRSALPKPLHELAGRSLLGWVLEALGGCGSTHQVVVVGHGAAQVIDHVGHLNGATSNATAGQPATSVSFVEQLSQRGTGDAASVGLTGAPEDFSGLADILVLPGDTPLLRAETLADFVAEHRRLDSVCTVLTAHVPDATGYGRIVRGGDGTVERIVEHRDASVEERRINEMNTSIFCFRQSLLAPALRRITPDNAQGEFYLTDVVQVMRETGHPVHAHVLADPDEARGVNDRAQLAVAGRVLQRRINTDWLQAGVGMVDPDSVYVDVGVRIAPDAMLHPGTTLRGSTTIGESAHIGPHTTLTDCTVGAEAIVPHCVAEGVEIAAGSQVSPFTGFAPTDAG